MATEERPAGTGPYLPAELIPDIARRLTSLEDFFSLRAVCRAYRAVLPPSRAVLAAQPPHILVPRLLVPHPSPSLVLYHLPLRRFLRFRFRAPLPLHDSFTSDGARTVVVDSASRELVITHLLHGEQARIPNVPYRYSDVVLSGDLVLIPTHESVHYCRLGDGLWRQAFCGDQYILHKISSVNGILYALLQRDYLAVAKMLDNGSLQFALLEGEADEEVQNAFRVCKGAIFGECAGALLLIVRVSVRPRYKVFRWESTEKKWVRTISLGGRTLFVSANNIDGCLGPDFPGIRANCIYETLSCAGGWIVYSLDDDSCERFSMEYQGAPDVDCLRMQVWVLPSLF